MSLQVVEGQLVLLDKNGDPIDATHPLRVDPIGATPQPVNISDDSGVAFGEANPLRTDPTGDTKQPVVLYDSSGNPVSVVDDSGTKRLAVDTKLDGLAIDEHRDTLGQIDIVHFARVKPLHLH